MVFALYCKDIKEMIDLKKYNAEVFKSGKYVILHFKEDNEKVENKCLDLLRKKGLNCCPENCRWISQKEQARNKRNNVWITYNGEKRFLSDWLKLFKKSSDGYYKKRNKGYSDEDILNGWSFYENKQKRRNI